MPPLHGGPYRTSAAPAPCTVSARRRLDPAGLAMLGALVAAGSTPLVARAIDGVAIEGQAGAGFAIALGALATFLRQLRQALRRRRR